MKLRTAATRRRAAAASPAPPARKPAAPKKVKLKASVARSPRGADDEFEDYEDEEPNMKFGQAFLIVLILHIVAVAGVLTFNSIKAKQIAGPTEEVVEEKVVAESIAPEVSSPVQTAAIAPSRPAAEAPKAPSTTPSGQKTYQVLPGDTLTHIAKKHDVSIEALERANDISSYSTIRVGQELVIPTLPVKTAETPRVAKAAPAASTSNPQPTESAPPAPTSAEQAEAPAPSAERPADGVYEVVKGDNPYSIARRFGVSYDALMKENNIDDPTKLQIGEKLKIPGATASN